MVEVEKQAVPEPWWTRTWPASFGLIGAFIALVLGFSYLTTDDEAGSSSTGAAAPAPEKTVSRSNITPWPFSVDTVVLRCRTHSAVTAQVPGGREYALNGSAEAMGYPDPTAIWMLDSDLGHGLRVSLAGVIATGNMLC